VAASLKGGGVWRRCVVRNAIWDGKPTQWTTCQSLPAAEARRGWSSMTDAEREKRDKEKKGGS